MVNFASKVIVADDSGFLGLVDPNAYVTFVDEDWTLETLFQHFRSEMARHTMLLWETGGEEDWRVEVTGVASDAELPVFRSCSGPIRVTGGGLLLVNYEMLTMAAQFADEGLGDYIADSGLDLPEGDYICTISQMADPDAARAGNGPDFRLYLAEGTTNSWSGPAWSEF